MCWWVGGCVRACLHEAPPEFPVRHLKQTTIQTTTVNQVKTFPSSSSALSPAQQQQRQQLPAPPEHLPPHPRRHLQLRQLPVQQGLRRQPELRLRRRGPRQSTRGRERGEAPAVGGLRGWPVPREARQLPEGECLSEGE